MTETEDGPVAGPAWTRATGPDWTRQRVRETQGMDRRLDQPGPEKLDQTESDRDTEDGPVAGPAWTREAGPAWTRQRENGPYLPPATILASTGRQYMYR